MASKPYLTSKQAEDAYVLKQRQDEDPDFKPPQPSLLSYYSQHGWKGLTQSQRDLIVADFEEEMYQVFGCFPKANWMK